MFSCQYIYICDQGYEIEIFLQKEITFFYFLFAHEIIQIFVQITFITYILSSPPSHILYYYGFVPGIKNRVRHSLKT